MKRLFKSLLVLVAFFATIVIGGVKAEVKEGTVFNHVSTNDFKVGFYNRYDNNGTDYDPYYSLEILHASGRDSGIQYYSYTNGTGDDITAYCLDPSALMYKEIRVEKELVNNNKATGRAYSFEVAIKDVLKKGNDSNKVAVANAVRFVSGSMGMTIDKNAGSWPGGRMMTKTYISQGALWISESRDNYKAWYQALYGKEPTSLLSGDEAFAKVLSAVYGITTSYSNYGIDIEKTFVFYPYNDTGRNTLNAAKTLFINALKEAAKARMAGDKAPKKDFKLALVSNGEMKEKRVGDTAYLTRDITYVVNTANYDRTAGFIRNFNVTSAYGKYMTIQYSTDGNNYQTLAKNTNLVSLGASKVYVRIHIEGPKSAFLDCEEMPFTFTYNYYDPSFVEKAYILTATVTSAGGKRYQRMVAYVKVDLKSIDDGSGVGPDGLKDTIKGSTELCGACDTEITIPKDCTELGESVQTEDVISRISAPEKVTKCILKKSDDAGNSYKASTCNGGVEDTNPYCSVYCKEDYATVRFSGVKQAQSGRYFKVNGRIEGTKTCYTSSGTNGGSGNAINVAQYENDIAAAQTELIEAYIEYKKVNAACDGNHATGTVTAPGYTAGTDGQIKITNPSAGYNYSYDLSNCNSLKTQATNRLKAAQNKYNSINNQYNACTSWTTTFNFNQDIYYTYSENYSKLLNDEQTKMNRSCNGADCVTSKSDWYCSGDLSSTDKGTYSSCTKAPTSTVPTANRNYIYCDTTGCSVQTKVVPTAKYVKKAVNAKVDYTTNNQFYNVYTSGKITIKDILDSDLNASLVDGSPLSVKTEVGVYTFNYEIRNLGEFYDTCTSGRLSGASNSVVNALNKQGTIKFDGDYICYYTVDCPECKIVCVGPDGGDCSWKQPECPTCDPVIIPANTMFTDDLQVTFRPVTSSDIDPNNRDGNNTLGYNWSSNTEYELISEKAEDTKQEIEEKGALVENEEPILSVKMTPQLAKKIKDYNKNQESSGGYTNDSMVCYNYVDGKKVYDNIYCFSKFLDDMSSDSDSFIFSKSRLSSDKRNSIKDEDKLSKEITDSGYWTLYSKASKYDLGKYDGVVGGPAWK